MNLDDFYNQTCSFQEYPQRNLEEYLLAIYKNIDDNKDIYFKEQFSLELAFEILKESFTSEPAVFDEKWLEINVPPNSDRTCRKFTNPQIKGSIDKNIIYSMNGIEYTLEVLKFQIAELHKMRGKQLDNELRYFGVVSETGHSWYNFDPVTNIECGIRCMEDNEDDINYDWSFIGNLLEDGRIYE